VFSDGRDTFAVQIVDPAKVEHARGLINGTVIDGAHIGGVVTTAPADYNVGWSYHIAPNDVSFYDMSAEIGDASIGMVEEFVNSGSPFEEFLPHNFWGSWATFMVRELHEITGTMGSDTLRGTRSADIIFGREGSDRITGAAGDDFLIGEGGEDQLKGGQGDDKLGGGEANDFLYGNQGSDVLDGGNGADRMYGGQGNDIFIVDSLLDVTSESRGGGVDLVKSSISLNLASNIEQLKLLGAEDINGNGNAADNVLIGNSGNNQLWGLDGDDSLHGDGGDHRVASGDDHLYGGAGDDHLYSGEGNDWLEGGVGFDEMYGGLGDDVYVVSDSADHVYELELEGSDLVEASLTYTLGADVEKLTLIGTGAINGTGNDLSNAITGNGAANVLSGGGGDDILIGMGGADTLNGGTGNDSLSGGTGADAFLFNTALSASKNVDKMTDFSVADDTILLDQSIFAALSLGILSEEVFAKGTAAWDSDDRIVYDSSTGAIYYDADGNGSGAQVLFAEVTAGILITHMNFHIVG
jgi:Ca2+-binding RTX toxin-like protein